MITITVVYWLLSNFVYKFCFLMVGTTLCHFSKSTLESEWDNLAEMTKKLQPKVIILTSLNDPSG